MAKSIYREIKITYKWWRTDGKSIRPYHVEALSEKADRDIKAMMAEGFTSGELTTNLANDPANAPWGAGTDYRGHWETQIGKLDC